VFLIIITAIFCSVGIVPFAHAADTIANPLKVNSIQCFISVALNFVVDLLAIAAVLYIMWAGFLFVKAQGNPDELKTAKLALLHALIGTAIVLGAWGLATVVANTVNKVTQTQNGLPSQSSCNS